jgi:hypothetical protein
VPTLAVAIEIPAPHETSNGCISIHPFAQRPLDVSALPVGNPRSSKRNLEKARQERSAAKRDRRQGRAGDETDPNSEDSDRPAPLSEEQALAALAALHEAYAAEQMSFDEFDERKAELMARIHVQ